MRMQKSVIKANEKTGANCKSMRRQEQTVIKAYENARTIRIQEQTVIKAHENAGANSK
jgi:hypothetical protein